MVLERCFINAVNVLFASWYYPDAQGGLWSYRDNEFSAIPMPPFHFPGVALTAATSLDSTSTSFPQRFTSGILMPFLNDRYVTVLS